MYRATQIDVATAIRGECGGLLLENYCWKRVGSALRARKGRILWARRGSKHDVANVIATVRKRTQSVRQRTGHRAAPASEGAHGDWFWQAFLLR